MMIAVEDADTTLNDLRYASVDDVPGQDPHPGTGALPGLQARRAAVARTGAPEPRSGTPPVEALALSSGGARAPARPVGRPRPARTDARAPRAKRLAAGLGALAGLAALLAGCSRDAGPQVFAVPTAAAARIRMVCPPGTFVGGMTANCPQPLPRRPPPPSTPDQ